MSVAQVNVGGGIGAGRPIVLVAAVALIDADGRVLLAERPAGKHLAGMWEFPGGKVQPGETPEVALIRELMEELGIVNVEILGNQLFRQGFVRCHQLGSFRSGFDHAQYDVPVAAGKRSSGDNPIGHKADPQFS